jgi:hypothetical protein
MEKAIRIGRDCERRLSALSTVKRSRLASHTISGIDWCDRGDDACGLEKDQR